MQKFIIAALATVSLGKMTRMHNSMVNQQHAQLNIPTQTRLGKIEFAPLHSYELNPLKVFNIQSRVGDEVRNVYTNALDALSGLTHIEAPNNSKEVLEVAEDLYKVYKLVNGAPTNIALNMLLNFEKYHAIVGLFCADNNCFGDIDLMGTAFRTVEGMSEEDIELAIAVYTIADRLFDEVVDVIDAQTNGAASEATDKISQMITDKIIDIIVKETGLPEEIVRLVISQSNGDFKTFLELLKTANKAAKAGKTIVNMTSIISGNGDPSDLVNETKNLIDTVTDGKATDVINGIDLLTGGDSEDTIEQGVDTVTDTVSDISSGLSSITKGWGW